MLVALIAGLPAIIAAIASVSVHRQIKTPSGTTLGKQVEDVNHTARSNWHMLSATTDEVGVVTPAAANDEAHLVTGLESPPEMKPDG